MNWRRVLPLAALVFAVNLVLQAPASRIATWWPPPTLLGLSGVSGTVAHGMAQAITANGKIVLSDLHWRLRPWSLVLGSARYAVRSADPRLPLQGRVRVSLSAVHVADLRVMADLSDLLRQLGYGFLPVDAALRLRLARLDLRDDGRLEGLAGTLQIHRLRWNLGRDVIDLGDFSARLVRGGDGALNAAVRRLSGPLDVNGTLALAEDGAWRIDLHLRARPEAPAALRTLIQELGPADAAGDHEIRRRGRLPTGAA